ncbi:MAG: ribosome maturation factor RimM [Marivibrio sp.]|uniref:ribosome maturation factor RimM n=1 Tax=Marivibrio sp. TaxID=2039719 RepID=UPI0032EEA8E6
MLDGLAILGDGSSDKPASREGRRAERLLIGTIGAAHGVRGLVRVKSFTEDPGDLTAYGLPTDRSGAPVRLQIVGETKGQMLARIEGVADRTAAEAWRGVDLYIERASLPAPEEEDDFYHADLLGLPVEDPSGATLGVVRAIHDFGAGDVLELATPDGDVRWLPFTKAAVPTVDLAAGKLIADPPAEVGDPEAPETADGETPS